MKRILTIANISVMENLRNKTVYFVFAVALFFVLVGSGFNPTTVTQKGASAVPMDPYVIAVQVAFHIIVFLSMTMCSLLSMSVLSKEFEQGTIIMALARPVSRAEFALGKLLSVLIISVLNMLLLGIVFFVMFYIKVDQLNFMIFPAFVFIFLCMILITMLNMLFSFFLPRMAVSIVSLFVYLASVFTEIPYYFKTAIEKWEPSATTAFLNTVLPDFGELQFTCASLFSGGTTFFDCLGPSLSLIIYSVACWCLLVYVFKKEPV